MENDRKPTMSDYGENICGHCRRPIDPSRSGLRHFGFFVAHREQECMNILEAEIAELRARLAEREKDAARVALLVRALEAIYAALADGDGGSYWPARKFLDDADVFHGDLNDLRVLGAVAKVALAPDDKHALLLVETYGRPTGERLVISKLTRKVDEMAKTMNHLHDRLAGLKASNRNKASQIARLIQELAAARGQLNS